MWKHENGANRSAKVGRLSERPVLVTSAGIEASNFLSIPRHIAIHRSRRMFVKLSDKVWASPQIGVAQVAEAAAQGIGLIINNRPEGESDDQTPGIDIEAAARAAGIAYVAIPVTHAGFSQPQVSAMVAALADTGAPVLAYCRSGTRSTLLWALAEASQGVSPDELASKAASAGYDVSGIAPLLDMLSAKAREA
jgi:uncharacterized protein (TIGR01244 family)